MSTRKALTAAIYLRVSLDATGEGLAVERQRQDCHAIAQARGWRVVGEYVDNSLSASKREIRRPAYDQLRADFEAGKFDALVCWDLDRLTRQPWQLEDWIEAAELRGLRLVTANGEADLSTDGGRLFARIKASVARAEIERKSARQVRAAQQRARDGKVLKGVRLTGYTTDGDLVPDEAARVARIFEMFADGVPLRGIARALNDEQAPTRSGRPWNPSSVRDILTNAKYTGAAVYRGARTGTQGRWPAIVSDDLFRIVEARLADPRRRASHVGTARAHLGSGLYLCGECGEPCSSWSGNRYRCPRCGLTRAREAIDEAVLFTVRRRLALPELSSLLAPSRADEVQALAEQVTGLQHRLERIGQDYDDGIIDGARYRSARDKVEAQMRETRARIVAATASSSLAVIAGAADPVAAFDAAPLDVRRQCVAALVEVRLFRAPRGRRAWSPDTVRVSPRGA